MKPLEITYSPLERVVFLVLALAIPITLAIGLNVSDDHPDIGHWISFGVFEVLFLFFVVISWRFRVRVDDDVIFHREITSRSIPIAEVQAILIAAERKGPIQHLKVQIQGENARIMVAWRTGKMRPLVERLTAQFPDKVERVSALPDV